MNEEYSKHIRLLANVNASQQGPVNRFGDWRTDLCRRCVNVNILVNVMHLVKPFREQRYTFYLQF